MFVGRICSRVVATATGNETIRKAAQRMADHDVGTLVVVEASHPQRPVGIITDRDLSVRCIAAGLSPDETAICTIMTTPVHSVNEQMPIEDAVAIMGRSGTRRLVVVGDDTGLAGLLSIDDILGVAVEEAGAIGQLLEQQKPRIPA